jgi:CO/xanthine dehydrogenase Mo-binding subunit
MGETMQRRVFLGLVLGTGAGLAIGCGSEPKPEPKLPETKTEAKTEPKPQASAPPPKEPFAPDQWVRVAPDGSLTVVVDKAEMGQGTETGIAMLVAEELEIPFDRVHAEFAPADTPKYKNKLFGMQATGGSSSITGDYEPLRKAGAAARIMLIGAGAERLGVPAAECHAEKGEVVHGASGRRVPYKDLIEAAAKQPVPQNPELKPWDKLTLVGTRPVRLDAKAKGQGTAVFGIDVKLPDLLTAVVVRSPMVDGGKAKSFDPAPAMAVRGVKKVVELPSGIAVVGEHFWAAKKGAEALKVEWDEGPAAKLSSDKAMEEAKELVKKPGAVAEKKGDFDKAFKAAKKKVEVVYELPFQAHAPMEPLSCTAYVRGDGVDVWVATQAAGLVQMTAAKVAGVKPEDVKVHSTYLGGGFGRRFEMDYVVEAVLCAKQVGAPVKVQWTREDDMHHDFYRPQTYNLVRAGLDDKGAPAAVSYRVVSASIATRLFPQNIKNGVDHSAVEGLAEGPYAFSNLLVDYHMQNGIPVGFWRSVGHSTNAFVQESLLDELAALAKQDPYQYRRKLLTENPRLLGVLDLVADKSGWGKPLPAGKGRGIAAHASFRTFVAHVVEVTVDNGKLKVDRVVSAIDAGAIVHPGMVEQQVEGSIVFALTAALKSSIKIENGRVKQSNFHNFKLLQIDETPAIEVYVVPSKEKSGGVGEPATPPVAPALANAIFAATGKRLRRLPITEKDLKA